MRPEVRVLPDPPVGFAGFRREVFVDGVIAQLVEHLLCKQGVVGSIPTGSTTSCCPFGVLLKSLRTHEFEVARCCDRAAFFANLGCNKRLGNRRSLRRFDRAGRGRGNDVDGCRPSLDVSLRQVGNKVARACSARVDDEPIRARARVR